MKKKYSKEINYIRVNLNKKNKTINKNNSKVNSYIKVKEKYDSYLVRNKNLKLVKENLTLGKITREERQNNKIEPKNLSLSPFIPQKKVNSKKAEELKKLERNAISMRRLEYSIKVKDVSTNKKKYKNNKYNINKIITIQKWIKGFLLRSFLSNVCECELIMNDFIKHINKYIFLKINIFQKFKNYFKDINDNVLVGRKSSVNGIDNISISIINTNTNTNTFTNNNTFSLCQQDTTEIFENDNRKLITNSRNSYNNPSIRELLMANSDINNNIINVNNKNIQNKVGLKNSKNIQRAKSLNDIKNINKKGMPKNNIYSESKSSSSTINMKKLNSNQKKDAKEINKKEIKAPNLRTLLFNNISTNNDNGLQDKTYKKPINIIMYITKVSYYNNNDLINNYSPKSEKLFMPKVYNLSLEDEDNNINNIKKNLIERNENGLLFLDNIEEIKEVKEDEEEDSQSQLEINKNTTILDNEFLDNLKEKENESILSDFKREDYNDTKIKNNNKIKLYNISSNSFQIKSSFYDKRTMFIVLLLKKQIMFNLKTYLFNLLKKYWKNKISL